MTEFVAIGDLHLTASNGKGGLVGGLSAYLPNPDQFVVDLVRSQPLRYAAKHRIKNIILLGDICEKTRLSYEGQLALISLLRTRPFHFHIILGNHDLFGADPTLGHSLQIIKVMQLPNVSIYEKVTDVEIDGAPIRFLPWPHSNFSKNHLNVAHIDVKGAKSDSGRVFDKEDMPSSNSTAIIGHIHTNQRVRNSWFAGTLYQTDFGEGPDKFFQHLRYDDGEFEIENIPVKPSITLMTYEVATKADLKRIPRSDSVLVKLILLPGCKLLADDYADINVKRVRPVTTERDLALARIEDLNSGSEIEISTDEFFKEWLRNSTAADTLKRRAYKIRKRLLESA